MTIRWMLAIAALVLPASASIMAQPEGMQREPAAAQKAGISAADQAIRRHLQLFLARAGQHHQFAGSVLIASGDEILHQSAHGSASPGAGTPLTVETRFDLGSASGVFTAAAIFRLGQQGKLALNDPVVKFFPEIAAARGSEGLTIEQLLRQVSGIQPNLSFSGVDAASRDAIVAHILQRGASRHGLPGQRFHTAAANEILLAAIVEVASGERFEAAMKRLIFEPAGMDATMFRQQQPTAGAPIASVLDYGTSQGTAGKVTRDRGPAHELPLDWSLRGAAGVLTNVGDLHRFARALAEGRLLDEAHLRSFLTPAARQYAHGWSVSQGGGGSLIFRRKGSAIGFESVLLFSHAWPGDPPEHAGPATIELPPGMTIAIASNRPRGSLAALADQLARLASGEQVELPPDPVELSSEQWRAVSARLGSYTTSDGTRFALSRQDRSLTVSISRDTQLIAAAERSAAAPTAITLSLMPESTSSFAVLEPGMWRTTRIVFGEHEGRPSLTIRSDDHRMVATRQAGP